MSTPAIPVLINNNDFIIVNKPIGVEMHHPQHGICQLVQQQESTKPLYLVHRLDKDTSGCLLLAKNQETASVLSQAFRDRQISKYYLALITHKPKKKQGKIQGFMKKTRGGNYSLRKDNANDAHSSSFALTFFVCMPVEHMKRLVYLKPVTGKTHQLRVALKTLGSPILGDKRYKGEPATRLCLHSYMLKFAYKQQSFEIFCLPDADEYFSPEMLSHFVCPTSIDWPKYKFPKPNNTGNEA